MVTSDSGTIVAEVLFALAVVLFVIQLLTGNTRSVDNSVIVGLLVIGLFSSAVVRFSYRPWVPTSLPTVLCSVVALFCIFMIFITRETEPDTYKKTESKPKKKKRAYLRVLK